MDRHGSPSLGPRNDASSRITKPDAGGGAAADKLAALKARVAAAISGSGSAAASASASAQTQQKKGLNVELHPALADTWKPASSSRANEAKQQSRPRQPQAGQSKPQKPDEAKSNPYFNPSLQGPQQRQPRHLRFHEKGKFIEQGQALRRQAKLEELKKRIASTSKRAGIDEDADVEKNFVVDAPPDVEWWDEGLLVDNSYDAPKLDGPDAIVTPYIQHPVQIEPDGPEVVVKPMYLTAKEQKKIRRQRRHQDMKEEQAKQRLGLLPAPVPRLKLGNMMRTMGEQAVKDPTQIEAMVRSQIREREETHLQMNADRQLTKEEREEKLQRNQEADANKGLHLLVFKIMNLSNGSHRWKINRNSEDLGATGLALLNPRFNLVIMEGGPYAIRKLRHLMVDRIDWGESAPSRVAEGKNEGLREWLKAENEDGSLKDLSANKCVLLFDGEVKTRAFKKFSSRVTESDSEAREFLARVKMENFWNLAKSTS
ncbi:hypothetical protein JX265_005291 [Neoarthrinium moseri]|uniref:Uncharacterized protein n=1 Tax=Neoarthrinium moseri TaxID=1658444 RepID=A0A9Q0ASA3_9PEZI|nr:uncharacterized protein JN550_012529 [Neoarthrinium moseri]KAI1845430.1 hypothetical protein JX266_008525 [Neoarthrinium moseri]KAI1858697.1 hypothetical protein JN550_012529 [Neoarthrinium moseri]KAI1873669.1 hypothetical protein JX265_005291 [Neoarthrinium moseri]